MKLSRRAKAIAGVLIGRGSSAHAAEPFAAALDNHIGDRKLRDCNQQLTIAIARMFFTQSILPPRARANVNGAIGQIVRDIILNADRHPYERPTRAVEFEVEVVE